MDGAPWPPREGKPGAELHHRARRPVYQQRNRQRISANLPATEQAIAGTEIKDSGFFRLLREGAAYLPVGSGTLPDIGVVIRDAAT